MFYTNKAMPRLVAAKRKCWCSTTCRTADYASLFQKKTGRRPTVQEIMTYTGKSRRTIYRHKKVNVRLYMGGLKRSDNRAARTRHKICIGYIECVNKGIYPSAPKVARAAGVCERTAAIYLYGKGKEDWERDVQQYSCLVDLRMFDRLMFNVFDEVSINVKWFEVFYVLNGKMLF